MTRPSRSGTATPSRMTVRPCSTPMILRRPVNTAVIEPVPSDTTTSSVGDAVARGDHDAVDLAADPDRPARHDLGEVGDPEALAAVHQAGPLELVDRGPQPLAQRLHSHGSTVPASLATQPSWSGRVDRSRST